MDNNNFQKVRAEIEKNDKIAIAIGTNPSVDAMAAALALSLGLARVGKKVSVVTPTPALVEHSSLVGINKVKNSYEGDGGDLVVSFPYKEGEIEKVSYTIESGFLNIVVKAGQQGLTFEEQDVSFKRGGGALQLLIVIGTQALSQLENTFDPEALKNTTIVNIDNNPANEGFGDIIEVSEKVASVSELVTNLLFELGIDPDVDESQNLLNGISSGTNNFQDPRTDFVSFELAANLMRKGAVRTVRQMPRQEDTDALQSLVRPQAPIARPNLTRPNLTPRPQVPAMPRPQMQPRPQMPQRQPMPAPTPRTMPQPQPRMSQNTQDEIQQKRNQLQDMLKQQDQGSAVSNGAPQDPTQKPPSDWLTPKVYKGSSDLNN